MKRFFRRHWKTIAIIIVAIIAIALVIALVKKIGSGSNNTSSTAGVVTLDGNSIGVFDTQSEAEDNKVTVDAGIRTMKVSASGNIDVKAKVGGLPTGIITNTKGNSYELDLSGIGDGSTVVIEVSVGGDGSLIGKRLSGDVDTYYFAVSVNNPDTTVDTAETLNIPNGKVYFGDDSYQTYGSESEAQAAVAAQRLTLPTYMVKDGLSMRAEPNENTARIWASICMIDGESTDRQGVRLNQDSDWSGVLDVSEYAGHQITLMLKAENAMALSNGYSYVSFFVPEFDAPEEEYIPPVINYD